MMPDRASVLGKDLLRGGLLVLAALVASSRADETDGPPTEVKFKVPALQAPQNQPASAEKPETASEKPQPAVKKPEEAQSPFPTTGKKAQPKATLQPEAKPEPKPELTAEMVALRDRVRRTLAMIARQRFDTRSHSATDIMHLCLAFGCEAEVPDPNNPSESLNAVTCLCWNYPCAGSELLIVADGRITARIGYGAQTQRSQFLAVLAQAQVPADYPVRVDEDVRKVADLVEYEKLHCREGVDASLALIGLSFYTDGRQSWKNDLGEEWSIERLVDEELDRPIVGSAEGGTCRLMGLSQAVRLREARKQPIEGPFLRARLFVGKFQDFALRCQNPDGTWHPDFFAAVGTSRDMPAVLRSTGRILEWLVVSLPEKRLDEPGVVRAVAQVNTILGSRRYLSTGASLSPRETAAMLHAVHALLVYDERFFRPREPRQPAPEETARRRRP